MVRLPIEKRQVWQAYQHVRMNKGTYGVDEQDWEQFDRKRYHNLYILWNRLWAAVRIFQNPCDGLCYPKPAEVSGRWAYPR